MRSDMGGFPAIYFTNSTTLAASVGETVSQFSAFVFMDVSERVPMTPDNYYFLYGMGDTTNSNHTSLLIANADQNHFLRHNEQFNNNVIDGC